MKKYFLAILLGISLLLMQANISFASTLYTNTLTGDFWNNFYAPCSTSNNGLTCPIDQSENQAGIGINTTQFSNMACVSGDFTSNGGPNQLFIFDQPTDLNSYVVMYIQSGNNLQMNSNINSVVDSGVPSPTWGIHTYMLCKSSDTYTSYVDGSLVQTQIYSSHTGGYAGFQAANGEYFTNFAVKDALPNNNPNIIYSNPMTSNFWNTFFNPCNTPTSSGITCNATSAMNTTQLSSNKCVTFDADSSTGSPQILLGEDPYLINLFAIDFNDNTTINIKDIENNDHDTGISVPSGAHNYGVCQDTNQLTVYIDSSPVYIYTATTFPHLDYFGFTLFPGTHLTNLKVTDTIPQKQLTALDPATVWVKTNFPSLVLNLDLKAEVYKDSTLITSGQINSVGPGTTTTAEQFHLILSHLSIFHPDQH